MWLDFLSYSKALAILGLVISLFRFALQCFERLVTGRGNVTVSEWRPLWNAADDRF